jgi:biopolymer transport protein ExbB
MSVLKADPSRYRSLVAKMLPLALIAALALTLIVPAAAQTPTPAGAASETAAAASPVSAPAAPTITAPPVAKPAKTTELVENPYGLEALWRGSDWVAKIVLIILLIMSVGSWYIMIVKVLEQAKMVRQAKATTKGFWNAGSVRQGADTLDANSPFRFIAEAGIEAGKKHGGLLEHVDLNQWITMSIQRAIERVQSRMQDGLAFLATVGSTAPFIGLFGTVWGIYHALTAIGVAGQASIDKVAGPVGEALIMTAIGLAVAVPAVLGYNWLVRRNKRVMDEVRGFGNDLHSVILSSAAKL